MMNTKKRSAIRRAAGAVIEFLEDRRLLSGWAQISDTTSESMASVLAFNTIATGFSGAGPSRVETVTVTNTGGSPLAISGVSVVNDASAGAVNASNFTITNPGSLSSPLAPGSSAVVKLQYSATAVASSSTPLLQSAVLQIQSNDPVTPVLKIDLHGIGTAGQFGVAEPSLVQILRANDIPTIVGEGPNDSLGYQQHYPITPDPSSQEVLMQQMVVAGPGPVTITPIASFSANSADVTRVGYYTPGDPNVSSEVQYIRATDAQTMSPTAMGATSFDPGTKPFGLYGEFPANSTPDGSFDIHYSEDQLNIFDPTHSRKMRFFPLKTANGTVVPNTFVVAIEDFNDPTTFNGFVNYVGIIRNVKAAPAAPVLGVQEGVLAPGSNELVFNTIKNPNQFAPDIVHNTNTVTINNTGQQLLVINSVTLSDTKNWMVVNPPAPGTSVAPGSSLTLTIQFIATSNPPHSTNETNDIATTIGLPSLTSGGVWTGTLTVNSNDPINPTRTVNLAGYWQDYSEHEMEPSVTTLTNLMFGYTSNTTGSASKQGTEYLNNGSTPVTYGSEVDPSTNQGLLVAADPGQPVSLIEAAAFHQQYAIGTATVGTTNIQYVIAASETGTTVTITINFNKSGFAVGDQVLIAGLSVPQYDGTFTIESIPTPTTFTFTIATSGLGPVMPVATTASAGWYPAGGKTKLLYRDQPNNGQAMFPLLTKGSSPTVVYHFLPTGAFGVNLDGESSQDSLNAAADAPFNTSGHAVRFFPALDSNGNTIPNTWILCMDYRNYLGPNSDYQDLYMILTNATFESMPGTPFDVQITGATGGASLQWAPVAGAASYNVYQVVNGSPVKVNSSPITTPSYFDPTAPAGTVVKYQVTAVSAGSLESPAASASVDLSAATVVAPVAPAIQQADGSSGTQVSLSWTAPAGATAYNLQREDPGQSSFTTIASALTNTTYADTNVTAGLTYQYQVQATNSAGPSPFSPSASATVAILQSAPPTPTITQTDGSSGTQVVVTWGASAGATSYNVQRQDPGASSFSVIASNVMATAFTDTNVTSNATYMYEVQAQNASGPSAFSAPASVTVAQGPPAAPSNVQSSTASGNSVVLTWDATAHATSYDVQREGPGETSFSNIATGLTSPTYTDTGVSAGQTYSYQIIAEDAAGPSAASTAAVATLPAAAATLSITVGKGANAFVTFTTTAGALVSIKLKGSGTATVHFTADTISQSASGKGIAVSGTNVAIASITTTGTSAGSSLSVTTKGGGNTVNIGGISVDASLKAISAPTAALIGTLAVTGSVNNITLGSATAATMTIGGNLGTFRASSVTGVTLTAGGVIGNITATTWASNHAITAASINSINFKGDAQVDINAGVLHTLKVKGNLHDSTLTLTAGGTQDMASLIAGSIATTAITAASNLGSISAATLIDSHIYAGSNPLEAFPPDPTGFPAAAFIANVSLKKINGVPSFVNSSIAASTVKHAALGSIQFTNGGKPFGLEAHVINTLAAVDPSTGKSITFHNLNSNSVVAADLAGKGISPQDFAIEIV